MESSALKKAYDRWQGARPAPSSSPATGDEASLGALLGLPPDVVEEIATLGSRVELALAGASRRTVVVGSASRGCGTSTVAVGLAAALATTSRAPTLLVDANLRHPSLHAKFHLEREPGLSDVVLGRATREEVMRETAVTRLTLVTAGGPVPSPQGFFQGQEFREHLARWATHYSYVIMDSAPFWSVAEPMTLAQAASGVVMVVEAERTVREVAADLVDDLRASGAQVLGVVLNKRKYYIPEWIYRRV